MSGYDGQLIDLTFLTECVDKVKQAGRYTPSVLILSEDSFHGLVNAVYLHGYQHHIANGCKKLGLKRVVWAEDVPDNEFLLSSGKGLEEDIEELIFKDD